MLEAAASVVPGAAKEIARKKHVVCDEADEPFRSGNTSERFPPALQ